MLILQSVAGVAGPFGNTSYRRSLSGRSCVIVGKMPSRKAPVIIFVDAKICLLFPVGSWRLLDSPGTEQKLGTLYRGRGHSRASWLLRLRLRCRRQRLHAEHRLVKMGPT